VRRRAAGIAGLLLGVALARAGAGWTAQQAAVAAAEDCPPCPPWRGPEIRAADCAPLVAAAEALGRRLGEAGAGEPAPFPDDLPVDYTPAAFQANVDAALRDCPPSEPVLVDCSEFPCLIAGPFGWPGSCPAWDARYRGTEFTRETDAFRTAAGEQGLTVTGEWPPDQHVGEEAERRLAFRIRRLRDQRMQELGGRERTADEERQEAVASTERMLEDLRQQADAHEHEALRSMIEMLEQHLAALRR
jgi:hypothetical protein